MKEFDVFVPLNYNDGTPIDGAKFQALQSILLEHFEGLTVFPQPNKGFWKMDDVTYQDEIVIYRVLSGKARKSRNVLKYIKERLMRALRQEEILIIERDVKRL